jgi:hypothetical protein
LQALLWLRHCRQLLLLLLLVPVLLLLYHPRLWLQWLRLRLVWGAQKGHRLPALLALLLPAPSQCPPRLLHRCSGPG